MVKENTMPNKVLLWPKLFEGRVIDRCNDADSGFGAGAYNYRTGGGNGAGYYGDLSTGGGSKPEYEPNYYGGRKYA